MRIHSVYAVNLQQQVLMTSESPVDMNKTRSGIQACYKLGLQNREQGYRPSRVFEHSYAAACYHSPYLDRRSWPLMVGELVIIIPG